MTNRLPAEELLQVIRLSHLERRAESRPRPEPDVDPDLSPARALAPSLRDIPQPVPGARRSAVATPGF